MDDRKVDRRDGYDRTTCEAAARHRADVYGVLLDVFARLPDEEFLEELEGTQFRTFVTACRAVGNPNLRRGAAFVDSYCTGVMPNHPSDWLLNDLTVDRTLLLRGTRNRNPRPPYESLFVPGGDLMGAVQAVRETYRKSGLLPDDDIGEASDYLGVELDFMYQLCSREILAYGGNRDHLAVLAEERAFLTEHPGRWIGAYCQEAEEHATTDFYRGFLSILQGFIETDIEYLNFVPT